MRFLIVSITILALAIGYFAYTEVQGRSKLNNIPDPVASPEPVASAERTVREIPFETSDFDSSYTAQDEMDRVVDELGIAEEIEGLNLGESDLDLYEAFENTKEACCPEEELVDGKKKPMRERFMDMYLPKGFTEAEIHRYTDLTEKQLRRESLTYEEHMEFLELLVRFQPHETNFKAYEKWKALGEHIVPGSWSQTWTDN